MAYLDLSHFHLDLRGRFSHLGRDRKDLGVDCSKNGIAGWNAQLKPPSSNAPLASEILSEGILRHEQQFIVITSCFFVIFEKVGQI